MASVSPDLTPALPDLSTRRLQPLPDVPTLPPQSSFPQQELRVLPSATESRRLEPAGSASHSAPCSQPVQGRSGSVGGTQHPDGGCLALAFRWISGKHLHWAPFTEEEASSWFSELEQSRGYLLEADLALLVWSLGLALERGNGDLRSLNWAEGSGGRIGQEQFLRWLQLPDSCEIVIGLQSPQLREKQQAFSETAGLRRASQSNRAFAKVASELNAEIVDHAETEQERAFLRRLQSSQLGGCFGYFDDRTSETFFRKYDQTHAIALRRWLVNGCFVLSIIVYGFMDYLYLVVDHWDLLVSACVHRGIASLMYAPALVAFNFFPVAWMRYDRQQMLCFWSLIIPAMYLCVAIRLNILEINPYVMIHPIIWLALLLACLQMSIFYTALSIVMGIASAGYVVSIAAPDALTGTANMIDYIAILCLTMTAIVSQQNDSRLKTQAIFLSETKRIFGNKKNERVRRGSEISFDRGRLSLLKTKDQYAHAHIDLMMVESKHSDISESEHGPKKCCYCCCYSSFYGHYEMEYQSSPVEIEQSFLQLRSVLLQIVAQEGLAAVIHYLQSETGLFFAKVCFIIPVLSLVVIIAQAEPRFRKYSKTVMHVCIAYLFCVLIVASYFYSVPFNGRSNYTSLSTGETVYVDNLSSITAASEMMFSADCVLSIMVLDSRLDTWVTLPSVLMMVFAQLILHAQTPVQFRGGTSLEWRVIYSTMTVAFAIIGAHHAQLDRRMFYMLSLKRASSSVTV